jgi:hypothetical protein
MRPAVAMDTGAFRQFQFGDVISQTHQQPLVPMVWAADTAGRVLARWTVVMVAGMGWNFMGCRMPGHPWASTARSGVTRCTARAIIWESSFIHSVLKTKAERLQGGGGFRGAALVVSQTDLDAIRVFCTFSVQTTAILHFFWCVKTRK